MPVMLVRVGQKWILTVLPRLTHCRDAVWKPTPLQWKKEDRQGDAMRGGVELCASASSVTFGDAAL